MTKMITQQYGVGGEMEGFIVNGSRGQERINHQPSSEWLQQQVAQKFPQLSDKISLEEASVMLEIKSDVHQKEADATQQILEIRNIVNELLAPHGCKLIFQPVLTEDFEFVPASSDPNSRAQQLMAEWGGTSEGLNMLSSTAIASFQINDSRPFQNSETEAQRMEIARQIHNLYSLSFEDLVEQNAPKKNQHGQTRLDILFHLMTGVKQEQFAKHGFENPLVALIPPYFSNIESMEKWMIAHSRSATSFQEADCKNEHAATVKIKRKPYWAAETRIFDAVDTKSEINKLFKFNKAFIHSFLPTT